MPPEEEIICSVGQSTLPPTSNHSQDLEQIIADMDVDLKEFEVVNRQGLDYTERFTGSLVGSNVFNLIKKNLNAEISILSKGLDFFHCAY